MYCSVIASIIVKHKGLCLMHECLLGVKGEYVLTLRYQTDFVCRLKQLKVWRYMCWPFYFYWRCMLGGRKGIRPVKKQSKQSGEVLVWLSVWSKVQSCLWPSWCHCHSLSVSSVKSRLVLPFWYRLTWVVLDKGPLNGCVCVCEDVCFQITNTSTVYTTDGHVDLNQLLHLCGQSWEHYTAFCVILMYICIFYVVLSIN